MKTVILYYADGDYTPCATEEEALAREIQNKELTERLRTFSPTTILEKLINDLDKCQSVWPGTLCTCPYDSIRIKGMVKVCQEFVEKYKEYLKHY